MNNMNKNEELFTDGYKLGALDVKLAILRNDDISCSIISNNIELLMKGNNDIKNSNVFFHGYYLGAMEAIDSDIEDIMTYKDHAYNIYEELYHDRARKVYALGFKAGAMEVLDQGIYTKVFQLLFFKDELKAIYAAGFEDAISIYKTRNDIYGEYNLYSTDFEKEAQNIFNENYMNNMDDQIAKRILK